MTPPDAKLTSELLWAAALLTALIDLGFVFLLARHIRLKGFSQLKWPIAAVGAVVFGTLWAVFVAGFYWESCYALLFPSWSRWFLPPFYAVVFGLVGIAMWWLSPRLPGLAVVNFCLLGGLASLPGHAWAIYVRKMFEKCVLLEGASPASALVFGVFEFIFYWSFILTVAVSLRRALASRSVEP